MIDRAEVKTAVDAFASGDATLVDRYIDPEFEGIVPPSMSAEPDSYLGYDGVRRYLETFKEVVDDLHFEFEVADEVGEWALLTLHVTGTGRTSGLPVDNVVIAAVQMRAGKLWRMHGYPSLEEARAATLDDGPC